MKIAINVTKMLHLHGKKTVFSVIKISPTLTFIFFNSPQQKN